MMLKKFYCNIKIVALISIILLSGCSTYRQFDNQLSEDITQVTPRYVAIKNGRLEYYRFGKGSPIVLISGYVTDVTSWDKQFLATLAEKHQLIVFNNRDVGGSYVLHAGHYQSKDLANDTHQLIQKLHLKKPAVLGISMGGMIAQQVAVIYPKEIGQLILINTAIAGEQSIRPSPATQQTMLNMPTSKLGRYLVALKLFFPASQRTQMGFALVFNRFQPKNYTEIRPDSVAAQQKFLILHWAQDNATAKKLRQLNLPVLVLNGTADEVIPPVNSDVLANTIPHAKLKRWQDGGHAMIYQYPKSIANVVNDFIGLGNFN